MRSGPFLGKFVSACCAGSAGRRMPASLDIQMMGTSMWGPGVVNCGLGRPFATGARGVFAPPRASLFSRRDPHPLLV